jgi:TolB-like protein/tRNA A-37 threonylcarbamoyl transferase component Bud32
LIGKTLAHYRITAAIGSGGMGDVYRATDTRLGREVALKVLPPEMASSPERLERFRREAKALAALDHPGVVGVYSVEETDGVHFLTMQLVEGEPLEKLIPADGMEVPRILDIGAALAEALRAAHDKGIVHRDLKPANVMVTRDGGVKVLDFGLAKVANSGDDGDNAATDMKTREGAVMGTVPYMSPEQIQGQAVDHRTDIFSLGVILYELVTGQRPFQGRSSAALASAILRDTPRPMGELRAGMPDELIRVIERCLQKNAADRFQSAREVREALRGATTGSAPGVIIPRTRVALSGRQIALVAALLVVLAVSSVWFLKRGGTIAPHPASEMTLAVLPIENLGGDSATEYLADGMTGELSSALKKLPGLQVAGDLSTFRFKGTHADPAEIARQLGVGMLLTGKLQPGKGRVRLQMQLSNPDGKLLWSNTFDRENKDNFAMQDEITAAIASELRLVLSPATLAVTRAGRTVNPEAHDLFMRGQSTTSRLMSTRRRTSITRSLWQRHDVQSKKTTCWPRRTYCMAMSLRLRIGISSPVGQRWNAVLH